MSVAFDATFLIPLLFPEALAPIDPATGKRVEFVQQRLDYLVARLESTQTKIIIPTPALSELLVYQGEAGLVYLEKFTRTSPFKVETFDERAALEVALSIHRNLQRTGQKRGKSMVTWAKVKFDNQIVAIAKVNSCTAIYSDDKDVGTLAARARMDVVRLWELELPPQDPQMNFPLEQVSKKPDPEDD